MKKSKILYLVLGASLLLGLYLFKNYPIDNCPANIIITEEISLLTQTVQQGDKESWSTLFQDVLLVRSPEEKIADLLDVDQISRSEDFSVYIKEKGESRLCQMILIAKNTSNLSNDSRHSSVILAMKSKEAFEQQKLELEAYFDMSTSPWSVFISDSMLKKSRDGTFFNFIDEENISQGDLTIYRTKNIDSGYKEAAAFHLKDIGKNKWQPYFQDEVYFICIGFEFKGIGENGN